MAGVEVTIRRTSSGSQTTAEHRQTVWDAVSRAAVSSRADCPEESCQASLTNREISKHKALQAALLCGLNNPDCQRICLTFGTDLVADLGNKDFSVEAQETL